MTDQPASMPTIVPPFVDEYLSMVLLVDDQVLICEAVRRALLNESDIHFHYCTNPMDALRMVEEIKPTVILQDLVMPGMDGLDLVRLYRTSELARSVPVIVLSAKDEPSAKSDAFRAGANDYLVKLPDRIELIARIRYHTRAYLDHVQRDVAYSALRESQRQLVNANLELERLTRIDGLTYLGNRRYFDEYMEVEWRRAMRIKATISLLMIDVDNFKYYNDTYGHLAGDEVLRRVAGVLQSGVSRAGDLVARYGGEEFAVVLLNASIEGARITGDRIRQGVHDLEITNGNGLVTISTGVATMVPTATTSPNDLISAADVALFRAKAMGRNRVELDVSPER